MRHVIWAFAWCLVSRSITKPHTANWISEWLWQESTNLQKWRSHVRILHTRWVKHSKFHTEDPKTFGVNAENLVVWATWRPKFVHPWVMAKWLINYGLPSLLSLSCTQCFIEINTKCQCEIICHFLATDNWHQLFWTRIQTLVQPCDKCLNVTGGYAEVWTLSSATYMPSTHHSSNTSQPRCLCYLLLEHLLKITMHTGKTICTGGSESPEGPPCISISSFCSQNKFDNKT